MQGHSLGGSYASVCFTQFTERGQLPTNTVLGDLYAFASPRLGEQDFAKALKSHLGPNTGSSWRVVNEDDHVPKVPPVGPLIPSLFNHLDTGYHIYARALPSRMETEIGKETSGPLVITDVGAHGECIPRPRHLK
jgi:predicted lipase